MLGSGFIKYYVYSLALKTVGDITNFRLKPLKILPVSKFYFKYIFTTKYNILHLFNMFMDEKLSIVTYIN